MGCLPIRLMSPSFLVRSPDVREDLAADALFRDACRSVITPWEVVTIAIPRPPMHPRQSPRPR